MSKKIIDALSDSKGNITAVRFQGNSSFTEISIALNMAKKNQIENAHYVKRKDGIEYLRTNPNSKESDNLDQLAKRH